MVTGLVNVNDGLYEIRVHDGSGYLFNITKLGLKQSKTQMTQSGNFFVFEQKIQFLLNNGLKFEVLLSIKTNILKIILFWYGEVLYF